MGVLNIRLAALGLVLMMGMMPAQATIIDVDFTFSDPSWSATATYDDTSGEPWAREESITVFALNTLEVTLAGVATWDITELSATSTPPAGGLLKDLTGTLALSLNNVHDTLSGMILSALVFVPNSGVDSKKIIGPIVISRDPAATSVSTSTSVYTARASVPEPTTLALMGLGLAGIGYRRQRSKKAA